MNAEAPQRDAPADEAILWHDVECGAYTADLPLWRELAGQSAGAVLDVGAGTGRVTLDLAARGHEVTALDLDPVLLAELGRRARGLPVRTVVADARDFAIGTRFALILVPMQTVQLLADAEERRALLRCVRQHLAPAGRIALAITETLETYDTEDGLISPLPDMLERDGVVYSSIPTAIRERPDSFLLERRRERITASGVRTVACDQVRIARLTAAQLEAEAAEAFLGRLERRKIDATSDHVGSTVVMLGE